jgi:hypothetical protein
MRSGCVLHIQDVAVGQDACDEGGVMGLSINVSSLPVGVVQVQDIARSCARKAHLVAAIAEKNSCCASELYHDIVWL